MTFFILRATFQRCIENIGLDSSVGNKKGWCFFYRAVLCEK
jgi:hypothetical protein